MDIQTLNYVIALAKRQNFMAAADECAISQASLSKQLQKLEYEIGQVRLFDRSTRPITLTPAGEEFLRYANRIVSAYDTMLSSMQKYRRASDTKLRVGMLPLLGRLGVLPIISGFSAASSDVPCELEIVDRTSKELLHMVKTGEIDAAFLIMADAQDFSDDLTCYSLTSNEFALVVPNGHRLAGRDHVSLKELGSDTIISLDSSTSSYDICMREIQDAGLSPTNVRTCRNAETVLELVSAGKGAGLLSHRLLDTYHYSNICVLSLDEAFSYTLFLVIPNQAQLKPQLKDFINHVLSQRSFI